MLPSTRLSLISLSRRPYAAEPQLSSKRFPTIVIARLYITATPAPFRLKVLPRYSQLSEYMKWRPYRRFARLSLPKIQVPGENSR